MTASIYALHWVELTLLVTLVLDLGLRFYRNRRPRLALRLSPQGQVFDFGGALVFGSGPGADGITLPGPQVSRRHLEVRRAGTGLWARDLGSTNGTFSNGKDLREHLGGVPLDAGDRLELGRGGPVLCVVSTPAGGLLPDTARVVAWLALLWSGLFLGWQANLEGLPSHLTVGRVTVDFGAFLAGSPLVAVGLAASLAGLAYFYGLKRSTPVTGTGEAGVALQVFLLLGLIVLYPLLPAVALRYAQAAERAFDAVGAEAWSQLEVQEDVGALREAPRRYEQGRAALRWAVNLAARADAPLLTLTYFRQSFVLIAAVFLGLVLPLWLPTLRHLTGRVVAGLRRPLSVRLIEAADHGVPLAGLVRPAAYWDVACGFAAAAVVALTLWSPFGTSLGRGKSLYLALPGVPTVQSIELVKALFVLFMAGYFARQGPLLARVARRRYLTPYALAVLGTLALTGVQADLGALFMLGLFLGLVFVAATGHLRLVLWVPLLILPGFVLAALLGLTSVVSTRLGIWLAARTHPLGEQLVQARQLLLSSGWTGFTPHGQLSWQVPDIQGDLVFAAFGERFGLLGLLALVACAFLLVASLLRVARASAVGGRILAASVAALALVQFLTQAGGTMGLLPLTGVPIPWLSHGLTASLIFTLLVALALAADPRDGTDPAPPDPDPLRYLAWANGSAAAALAVLAVAWTTLLPLTDDVGRRGYLYRWEDTARRERIDEWTAAGLFEPVAGGPAVRLSAAGERHADLPELLGAVEGLRYRETEDGGEIVPLAYAVSNPNRFAGRSVPRGALTTRESEEDAEDEEDVKDVVVAISDDRGRRSYPLAKSFFHPVGYSGPLARDIGVEAAAGPYLTGLTLDWRQRFEALVNGVRHGPDLMLTLDAVLQLQAFTELDGRRGAAVLMDLTDGALLVLASSPAVDPGTAGLTDWRQFAKQEDRPLRPRSIRSTDAYSPPGSVFKIVVAAAALIGEVDPREESYCTGRDAELRVACAHGSAHGGVDLARALVVSCNVYFARLAVRLGAEAIGQMAVRFGFDEAEPVNLLRGVPRARLRAGLSTFDASALRTEADLARVGYGQGPVSATPLQIARMGAVVATGGELLDPSLVRGMALVRRGRAGPETVWWQPAGSALREQVLPRRLAEALATPLGDVFQGSGGTARGLDKLWWSAEQGWRSAARQPLDGDDWQRVGVAGKTGSAWKTRRDRTDDSWMVAWAPAEAPRLVVSVLVEDAGEGSRVAGPISIRLLRDGLQQIGHRP